MLVVVLFLLAQSSVGGSEVILHVNPSNVSSFKNFVNNLNSACPFDRVLFASGEYWIDDINIACSGNITLEGVGTVKFYGAWEEIYNGSLLCVQQCGDVAPWLPSNTSLCYIPRPVSSQFATYNSNYIPYYNYETYSNGTLLDTSNVNLNLTSYGYYPFSLGFCFFDATTNHSSLSNYLFKKNNLFYFDKATVHFVHLTFVAYEEPIVSDSPSVVSIDNCQFLFTGVILVGSNRTTIRNSYHNVGSFSAFWHDLISVNRAITKYSIPYLFIDSTEYDFGYFFLASSDQPAADCVIEGNVLSHNIFLSLSQFINSSIFHNFFEYSISSSINLYRYKTSQDSAFMKVYENFFYNTYTIPIQCTGLAHNLTVYIYKNIFFNSIDCEFLPWANAQEEIANCSNTYIFHNLFLTNPDPRRDFVPYQGRYKGFFISYNIIGINQINLGFLSHFNRTYYNYYFIDRTVQSNNNTISKISQLQTAGLTVARNLTIDLALYFSTFPLKNTIFQIAPYPPLPLPLEDVIRTNFSGPFSRDHYSVFQAGLIPNISDYLLIINAPQAIDLQCTDTYRSSCISVTITSREIVFKTDIIMPLFRVNVTQSSIVIEGSLSTDDITILQPNVTLLVSSSLNYTTLTINCQSWSNYSFGYLILNATSLPPFKSTTIKLIQSNNPCKTFSIEHGDRTYQRYFTFTAISLCEPSSSLFSIIFGVTGAAIVTIILILILVYYFSKPFRESIHPSLSKLRGKDPTS